MDSTPNTLELWEHHIQEFSFSPSTTHSLYLVITCFLKCNYDHLHLLYVFSFTVTPGYLAAYLSHMNHLSDIY